MRTTLLLMFAGGLCFAQAFPPVGAECDLGEGASPQERIHGFLTADHGTALG